MKYLYIFLLICISLELHAQSSNNTALPRAASSGTESSTFQFYKVLHSFDDCTFNSNNWITLKMTAVLEDGTVICRTFFSPGNYNDPDFPNAFEWGPLDIPRDTDSFVVTAEFSILPSLDPSCGSDGLFILNCNRPLPKCCFEYDCCDCGHFEDVSEGMWIFGNGQQYQPPAGNRLTVVSSAIPSFYPPAPNHIGYHLGGCTCCTF